MENEERRRGLFRKYKMRLRGSQKGAYIVEIKVAGQKYHVVTLLRPTKLPADSSERKRWKQLAKEHGLI